MSKIHYPHSATSKEEATALESRFDRILLLDVIKAFESSDLNLTPTKISKPDSYGTRHVIYIVDVKETSEKFIFRSNFGYSDIPEIVLKREKLMTDLAFEAGVPVNKILYVDVSRSAVDFDFQIQSQVPGFDLEDHFEGSQSDYDKLSVQLGSITARMHSIKLKGFGRFDHNSTDNKLIGDTDSNIDYIYLNLDDDIRQLAEANLIDEKIGVKIKEYFQEREQLITIKQGSLVHYDIADHNIMFQKESITGLIDWEAAVSSDPVLDIASMPTWKTHHPRLEKFLDGYNQISDLPDDFGDKMALYELRTILWKTVFCDNANILNDARKKRFTDCLDKSRLV